MAKSRSFTHTKLANAGHQIRLLRFSPDATHSSISCEIETFDLTDVPSYAAISYTWGSTVICRTIRIDGKTFGVGVSCYFALQQVANQIRSESRWFWTDSICIDQANAEEKGSQVNMMGDIFKLAWRVFSCVGPHAYDSDLLIQTMQQFGKDAEPDQIPGRDSWDRLHAIMRHEHSIRGAPGETVTDLYMRLCKAFNRFSDRDYWKRLWIVQEVLLAREVCVLCHFDAIFADTINYSIAYFLGSFPQDATSNQLGGNFFERQPFIATAQMILVLKLDHWHRTSSSVPIPFTSIFGLYAETEHSDDRDGIYALLRITDWPLNVQPPQPDYTITVVELILRTIQLLTQMDWGKVDCATAVEFGLLKILNLNNRNECVREFLNHRKSHQIDGDEQDLSRCDTGRLHYFSPSDDMPHCAFRITGAQHGGLKLSCSDSIWYWNEMSIELEHEERNGRALYLNDTVFGRVCNATRAGDWLLRVNTLHPLWLVARKSGLDQDFQIVGHAVLRTDFISNDVKNLPALQNDLSHGTVLDLDIFFDPEDYLAFILYGDALGIGKMQNIHEVERFGTQLMTESPTRSLWSSYARLKSETTSEEE